MTKYSLLPILSLASCALFAPAAAPAPPTSGHPIVFGMTDPIGENAEVGASARLADYLQKRIDPASTVRVFPDAEQLGAALAKGEIDAAWMSPGSYLRAKARNAGIGAALKMSRRGATSYRAVYIAKVGTPASLAAFQGRRIALGAAGSVSGRVYPLAHLKLLNIDPRTYFSEIVDAKDHAEVCSLVATGKVELGATLADDSGNGVLEIAGCKEAGVDTKTLHVIASSGQVPNDVIAVKANIDPALRQRLVDVLVKMPNDPLGRPTILKVFRADGFQPSDDSDFDAVRQMEELAGQ